MASPESPQEPADSGQPTKQSQSRGPAAKAAPKKKAQPDAATPEEQGAGRRTLSRAQQAELRRKLREKFH